ncbi:unnamed protein product [Rotaria sp. Silwood1]|nr:unnamed protein product [Rotaria sp. Silwood1]CAF4791462.1 unnamed protein product [Rotaria sp. Silwood1]
MATHPISTPSSGSTDEHVSHPLDDIDQEDMSQSPSLFTSTPPRKRSQSFLHRLQKVLHLKTSNGNHDDSSQRPRASSMAHPSKANPSERSSSDNYSAKRPGANQNDSSQRPRASSMAHPNRTNPSERSSSDSYHAKKTGANHDRPSQRQRASTIAHPSRTNPSETSPSDNGHEKNKNGRQRATTISSVGSTDKKMSSKKKEILDTDEKAQQSRSVFEFAFFH